LAEYKEKHKAVVAQYSSSRAAITQLQRQLEEQRAVAAAAERKLQCAAGGCSYQG